MITLRLSVPPSTNELYRNVSAAERARALACGRKLRGRAKTKAYQSWINAAGWELKAQRPGKIEGRVKIHILMRQPRANADCDNRFKAVIDFLVMHGVIDDDRNVAGAAIDWADVDDCVVTIRAAEGGAPPIAKKSPQRHIPITRSKAA